MTYLVDDITFYKSDGEGNIITDDKGNEKIFRIKSGVRVKAIEYLPENFEDDMMEEVNKNESTLREWNRKNKTAIV